MAKLTKKMKAIKAGVDSTKAYEINEAIALLKQFATAKFVESVDVAVNLGIDPRKSDQNVRGATVLPHGTGREVRVAVFTQGANADAAKEAGADLVGMEDLTPNVAEAVKNAKSGQIRYRNDKNGIIHTTIGKANFSEVQLKENLQALLAALNKAKPTTAKGIFIKKVSISTTMGAGVAVDQASL